MGAQPVLLEDVPKALESFDLNLPNPLAGQADLATDLLQGTALVPAQAEAAGHHFALLLAQFRQPVVDAGVEVLFLKQVAGVAGHIVRQGIQQGLVGIGAQGYVDRGYTLIESQHALDVLHRAVEQLGDLLG